MQGKGIIKFFLVVLTLMCLLQYFYLLPTAKVETNAEAYAQSLASGIADQATKNEAITAAKSAYLDSMSSEVIFSIPLLKKYTYEDLKNAQLNFGLDLKGGMSVVLQVDLKDFLKTVSGKSNDEVSSLVTSNSIYLTLSGMFLLVLEAIITLFFSEILSAISFPIP